jgi:transcriptional regulator with XRE-family HTH domain
MFMAIADEDKMTIVIQKLRLQRGWSQEQLADVSGVSVRTIQRIERGQPGSLETLKALAAVFDVDFDQLQGPAMTTTDTPHPRHTEPGIDSAEALAFAHVRRKRAFFVHLTQYVLVIGLLAVVNLMTSPKYLWFLWPALGWGLGLLSHGAGVFQVVPFLGADWERREVEKALGRKL